MADSPYAAYTAGDPAGSSMPEKEPSRFISAGAQGSSQIYIINSRRKMKSYLVVTAELSQISTLNALSGLFLTIGGGLFGFSLDSIRTAYDSDSKPPFSTILLIFVALLLFGLTWWFQKKRGSVVDEIEKTTEEITS